LGGGLIPWGVDSIYEKCEVMSGRARITIYTPTAGKKGLYDFLHKEYLLELTPLAKSRGSLLRNARPTWLSFPDLYFS
jgi:hypothetical protein